MRELVEAIAIIAAVCVAVVLMVPDKPQPREHPETQVVHLDVRTYEDAKRIQRAVPQVEIEPMATNDGQRFYCVKTPEY